MDNGVVAMLARFDIELVLRVWTHDSLHSIETGSEAASRRVRYLTVDVDFVGLLDRLNGWRLCFFRHSKASLSVLRWMVHVHRDELLAPFEYHSTHADIDEYVEDDDHPNGTVKGGDAEDVPVIRYPTPKLLWLGPV